MSATDPVVDSLRDKLRARSEVGLRKYGVGLNRTDLSHLEWLHHHQDELLDAALYVERQIIDIKRKAAQ